MSQMMFALSLGFGGVILATQIGYANPQCAPRAEVVDGLAQNYGETRRSLGIAANNAVMELYAADDTGTWTLTVTMPDGTTCLVASGNGYETITEPLPAKGIKI
jgi:hypothetical protein